MIKVLSNKGYDKTADRKPMILRIFDDTQRYLGIELVDKLGIHLHIRHWFLKIENFESCFRLIKTR